MRENVFMLDDRKQRIFAGHRDYIESGELWIQNSGSKIGIGLSSATIREMTV